MEYKKRNNFYIIIVFLEKKNWYISFLLNILDDFNNQISTIKNDFSKIKIYYTV